MSIWKIITINFNALSMCNSSPFCFQFVLAMIKNTRAEKQIGNVKCKQGEPLPWTHFLLPRIMSQVFQIFTFSFAYKANTLKQKLFSRCSAHADISVDCVWFQNKINVQLLQLICDSQRDSEYFSRLIVEVFFLIYV